MFKNFFQRNFAKMLKEKKNVDRLPSSSSLSFELKCKKGRRREYGQVKTITGFKPVSWHKQLLHQSKIFNFHGMSLAATFFVRGPLFASIFVFSYAGGPDVAHGPYVSPYMFGLFHMGTYSVFWEFEHASLGYAKLVWGLSQFLPLLLQKMYLTSKWTRNSPV